MFGSNYDKLINDIALEKLWYDYDYDGAMKFLKDCLEGIDDETCHLILRKQTKVVMLNSKEMDIDTENLDEGVDIEKWYNDKVDIIWDDCKGNPSKWIRSISEIVNNCAKLVRKGFKIHLDMDDYIYYLNNESDRYELFDDLKNMNDDIFMYQNVIKMIKNHIKTLEGCFKVASKLNHDPSNIRIPTIYYTLKDYLNTLTNLEKLKEQDAIAFEMEMHVQKYIDNTLRLNELVDIKPTTEYHDAGWIDRKGNYYGLNGDIANFLHLRIAELLVASHTLPLFAGGENPDRWMEEMGWMKQHNNELQYSGYYYNTPITKEQILTAKKILSQKYSRVELQNKGNEIPITRLSEIDDIQLRKHFA